MAFIPIPDGALVVIEYGQDGATWTNTLTFTQPGFDTLDQAALVQAVYDQCAGAIMTQISGQFSLRKVTCYDMRSVDGPIVIDQQAPVAGAKPGDPSPISIALVVTLYTAGRGRSARGRNYITGFVETDTDQDSVISATAISVIENAYNALIASAAAISWQMVITSRQLNGVPLLVATTRPVTAAVVRSNLYGSQRRRIDRP